MKTKEKQSKNAALPLADTSSLMLYKQKRNRFLNVFFAHMFLAYMLLLCFVSLGIPIVGAYGISLTPFNVVFIPYVGDIYLFQASTVLGFSFNLFKAVYIVLAVSLVAMLILAIYFPISKKKKKGSTWYTNVFALCLFVFLLVNLYVSAGFTNALSILGHTVHRTNNAMILTIVGFAVMVAKWVVGTIFNVKISDNIDTSKSSAAMTFINFSLLLSILFVPVFLFTGLQGAVLNGIGILGGNAPVFHSLSVSAEIQAVFTMLFVGSLLSIVINLVFYFKFQKIFVFYNKINNIVIFVTLLAFMLLGLQFTVLNAEIAYERFYTYLPQFYGTNIGINADGYPYIYNVYVQVRHYYALEHIFARNMITLGYIPLVLFVLVVVGLRLFALIKTFATKEKKITAMLSGNLGDLRANIDAEGGTGLGAGTAATGTTDETTSQDPIPAFTELDNNIPKFETRLQERRGAYFNGITLPRLVTHILDYAKNSRERLSYTPSEVKTFIAGLAASRLAVLQGMSGTGKTSLPKIFMEAIDGVCELVAVESSWRDKNELIGYYNEFSKKFTPKKFTQFLYSAALNKEVPYFIVLDEMNLSRIEYYFSDFLSLMESHEEERFIKLYDLQLYPKIDRRRQYLALRDGHTIDIPPNLWFIGTANRDESTFEISDKVYDRAQTMNFDKRAQKILAPAVVYPKKYVRYADLKSLFENAMRTEFNAESYPAIMHAEKLLAPYKISFGNRILKQMEIFIKVFCACGENQGNTSMYTLEAADCILLSKVVRKLELKQILNADTLSAQFRQIGLSRCADFIATLGQTDIV